MFKTEPHYYKGVSSDLTECLLNKTVTEGKIKKIDEKILGAASAIFKARHADQKKRFDINGYQSPQEASVLDNRIRNYTTNLESIFNQLKLSWEEGSDLLLLHNMKERNNV
ncbi:MAG: hypothetical protein KGQ54_02455 [Verrucomicrobia bacterium]|nr:hypothetical protein [Verrucomicrobiota bacterium]